MKSHVSNLLKLVTCVLYDAVAKCTDVTLEKRDLITIRSRVENEGISFLTITLPTFGKEIDISLSEGGIDPTFFRSFRKYGKAPAFLRGFFSQVFDETGRIKHEPCIEAIEGLRQIAYVFKKLKISCAPIRVRRALTQFSFAERVFEEPLVPDDIEDFLQCSHYLWSSVFGNRIDLLPKAIPKHGPGATAEKISGNAKFLMQRWHDRLEPYFPLLDNAFVNANARHSEEFGKVSIVLECDEQPVRVIPVPKTLKTPRIIAIEPVCMQYAQQAISEKLVQLLETHPLTAGHVNFTDQTINRDLAMISSRDQRYATIDLSSASDLVPYELAIRMFDSNPDLQDAISACRSKRAQMPDGSIIELQKFASMGSALCFPIEAMYFYTICVAALLKERNLPVTYLNIKYVKDQVFVYGDDIIIPTNESGAVTDALHKYYCKVNVRKSFSKGNFRESCGMDAFSGEEVTPTYIRELPPRDRRDTSSLVSWVSTANLFYRRGYWKTSSFMFDIIERITGALPVIGSHCAGLGKESFQPAVSIERWGRRYQRPEVRAWVPVPVYRTDILDGQSALLKSLLSLERSAHTDLAKDKRHLERSARHGAVALKRRWVRPY